MSGLIIDASGATIIIDVPNMATSLLRSDLSDDRGFLIDSLDKTQREQRSFE